MPRLDVAADHPLLVRVLRDPDQLRSLSHHQVSRVIDAAERARLLGWLLSEIDARQVPRDPPEWLADRLVTVRAVVRECERALRWEIDRLDRAFTGSRLPWVLLKGAAYVAAALPPGRGRQVADIDVLVPHARLDDAERLLNLQGWRVGDLDAYDERYYRTWMHELPPMTHAQRRSVVDVHHAILPRTSQLHPSAARLLSMAVLLGGDVRVLCPAHMVLHAAAHLFHDGEITGAIRDVVDLDRLLRHFGTSPDFWGALVHEAQELELTRPLYYALRYSQRMLGTPVAPAALEAAARWAPPAPVLWRMDGLVARAVPVTSVRMAPAAAFALYVRSHWLRMPPSLLFPHLLRKSLRRHKAS
ncbi:MAG: nucleotidyltransferase family protein [Acidobacteriota bacterium]